jgi:hypothetical protein
MSLHGGEHPFFEASNPCPAAVDAGYRKPVLDCSGKYQRKDRYHAVQFLYRRDTYYREANCPVLVFCNAAAKFSRRVPAKNSIRGACAGTSWMSPRPAPVKPAQNRRRFRGELNE